MGCNNAQLQRDHTELQYSMNNKMEAHSHSSVQSSLLLHMPAHTLSSVFSSNAAVRNREKGKKV